MPTTLEQYREAKNSFQKLKNQAKKELIARFNELASELLQVQRELLEDFGEKVTIPAKPKKPRAPKPGASKASVPPEPPAPPSAEAVALKKQLEREKKKLAGAQSAGKPVKAIEDRIYEIEDELRLMTAAK